MYTSVLYMEVFTVEGAYNGHPGGELIGRFVERRPFTVAFNNSTVYMDWRTTGTKNPGCNRELAFRGQIFNPDGLVFQ